MGSSNPYEVASVSVDHTKKVPLREFPDSLSVLEQDDLIFQEVFDVSDVSLCNDGLEEQLVTSNFTSDQEKGVDSKEEIIFKDDSFVPLNGNNKNGLRKSASFSCSADLKYVTGNVSLSNEEKECDSAQRNLVYISSNSLSATVELRSAMKGSRAQNGIRPNAMLHVKWASDVYDPPSSSVSHTVKKNHHSRSKAKKKNISKSKRSKGKSSRMNPEKRNANSSSICKVAETLDLRSNVSRSNVSSERLMGHSAGNQDSKCGSGFLNDAPAKVHISIGEAS